MSTGGVEPVRQSATFGKTDKATDALKSYSLLQSAEIAATIGFLVSDAASGLTGQVVMTDAGYSAS